MTPANTKPVEELFGTELARRLAQSSEQSWGSIEAALTTDYQKFELNTPEDSSISESRPNTRVATCDDSLTVISRTRHEYSLRNSKEAITKLLRFGLSDIHYRWSDQLNKLSEVDQAASITSVYLYNDDFTQSYLSERDSIEIPARQPSEQESSQVRVLWYEKQSASTLSNTLGVPMSDVLRCGILLAGVELGAVGDIPAPQHQKLQESIEKLDKQIQSRIGRSEQLVFGAIDKAARSDQPKAVVDELQTKCPHLWEEYSAAHQAMEELR